MELEAVSAAPASLYVGDLHPDVNDAALYEAFAEFKSLASVRVCLDSSTGRSLSYGYVNFVSPQDSIRAIDLKNHSTLNGKVIRVMWSHRDPDARRSGVGTVLIKNLSDSIDSVKLKEMFQKFGDILSCKVVTSDDGKSRGYGFVQFETEASAKAAIEKLNGSVYGGKQMFVGKFMKKSERALPSHEVKYTNLYVKNLDTGISEEVLKEKFSQYGNIVSLVISKDEKGASRGFSFVNFDKAEDARSAVEALHGTQLGSKVLYVARAQKKSERDEMLCRQFEVKRKEQILKYQASNVYVKNIDDDISDDELRLHFSQCGTITSTKIMRDDKGVSKGFGFVCFSTPEEANKAVYTFHGFILRRKPLYVAIAQRKEERQVQLQVLYGQRLAGLSGPPSPVIPGGYPHHYYPAPGVVPQIPAQPSLMYQQPGIRPGWRANGIPNASRPVGHPSPVTLAPNNSRQRPRGRMNGNALPQVGGLTYLPHLQRPIPSVASSKDINNQQMQSTIFSIPDDNIIEILCRLPVQDIVQLRGLHPYLRRVVRSEDFALAFGVREGFIAFSQVDEAGTRHILYEIDDSENLHDHIHHYRRIIFSSEEDDADMPIRGSVGGFFIMSGNGLFVVLNPATGQRFQIPFPDFDDDDPNLVFTIGFGKTGDRRLKIVLITQQQENRDALTTNGYVYEVGTDVNWRVVHMRDNNLLYLSENRITFLNGNHHWLVPKSDSGEAFISIFNMEDETFNEFPIPIELNHTKMKLSVVNDRLTITDLTHRLDFKLRMMPQYGQWGEWVELSTEVGDDGDDGGPVFVHAVHRFEDGDILLTWINEVLLYISNDVIGELNAFFEERNLHIMEHSATVHTISFHRKQIRGTPPVEFDECEEFDTASSQLQSSSSSHLKSAVVTF